MCARLMIYYRLVTCSAICCIIRNNPEK